MAEILVDSWGRQIDTLRLSITDQCNLNCCYCRKKKLTASGKSEILSCKEILKLASFFSRLGIDRLKITGGEPLLRPEVVELVRVLNNLPLQDLLLTTNGTHLTHFAKSLFQAGLRRVNVSLDTLQKEKYKFITCQDQMEEVLSGIQKVLALGFAPVKINVVLMKGINDDEILDFLWFSSQHKNLVVRFIELMPTRDGLENWRKWFVSREEVLSNIAKLGRLVPFEEKVVGSGPAEYFRIAGSKIIFGLISPVSKPFCSICNRLRVDCHGKLILCLHNDSSIELKDLLKKFPEGELFTTVRTAVLQKPFSHHLANSTRKYVAMCEIGG